MPLSKKNYEKLASILGNRTIKSKGQVINAISKYLKEDNPRFDRDRFVVAIAKHNTYYLDQKTPLGNVVPLGKTVIIGGKRFRV